MALIVAASVAIKWFIDEPGSDVARRLWRRAQAFASGRIWPPSTMIVVPVT
jgi:hypothetical protein